MRRILGLVVVVAVVGAIIWIANLLRSPQAGTVVDEALSAGRQASTFPAADEDYFHAMDNGAQFSPDTMRDAIVQQKILRHRYN